MELHPHSWACWPQAGPSTAVRRGLLHHGDSPSATSSPWPTHPSPGGSADNRRALFLAGLRLSPRHPGQQETRPRRGST